MKLKYTRREARRMRAARRERTYNKRRIQRKRVLSLLNALYDATLVAKLAMDKEQLIP